MKISLRHLRERWEDMGSWTRAFCFVAILNTLSFLALTLATFLHDPGLTHKFNPIFQSSIYLTIISVQVAHAYVGLIDDNVYELYATMVSQLVITTTVLIGTFRVGLFNLVVVFLLHWSLTSVAPDLYQQIMFGYAVLFQIVYLQWIYPLHKEFGWAFYRKAGADPVFRQKYRIILIFHAIFKMDLLLSLIADLSLPPCVIRNPVTAYAFIGPSCLFSISFYFGGRWLINEEEKKGMIIVWILALVQPAFAFTVFFWPDCTDSYHWSTLLELEVKRFYQIFSWIGIFGVLLRLVLVGFSIWIVRHFGEGLKHLEYIQREREFDDDGLESFEGFDHGPLLS